jgi:type IV fimbrial biogenesis protein FimT
MKYSNHVNNKPFIKRINGFTLVELLVTISILAIAMAIAIPNMGTFISKLRVDNEISQLNRLILTARNTAINYEASTTVCPLDNTNNCTNDWTGEISVFIDNDGDGVLDAVDNDTLIKVKEGIQNGDNLLYGQASLRYNQMGTILGGVSATPFRYCPKGYVKLNRGIIVAASGRSFATSDTDNDDKDEDRLGNEISCT